MHNKWFAWSLGIVGFLFAAYIGMWSRSLFIISESVHFSVNFPSGVEAAQSGKVVDCCDLGSPWERLYGPKWNTYPAGGVLVWGTEGQIILDVGKEGWIKRLLQPDFINLSSHWVRNVGVKSYKIRMDMQLCDFDLHWETPEAAWDPVTKTTTRYIEPGSGYNMDWYFRIPPEFFDRQVICDGRLDVYDAETGEPLSTLPIKLINSRAQ